MYICTQQKKNKKHQQIIKLKQNKTKNRQYRFLNWIQLWLCTSSIFNVDVFPVFASNEF